MKNAFFMEDNSVKLAFGPTAVQSADTVAARVSMRDADRITFILNVGTGTGADIKVKVQQHNAAASGTSKDLPIKNKYFVKADAATSFTQVEPTVAAATIELPQVDAVAGQVVLEVLAEQLDTNGGFSWVSFDVLTAGAAKSVNGIYLVRNTRVAPPYGQVY